VAGSVSIDDISVRSERLPEAAFDEASALAPVLLRGQVGVTQPAIERPLYSVGPDAVQPAESEASLVAIPYFRWANRGARSMRVWLPVETSRPS
jgi:DUF1680 family protein